MSQTRFVYRAGARLPNIELTWNDAEGDPLDLTTYTLTGALTLSAHNGGAVTTPDATLTGNASGVLTIAWAADDLDLDVGYYTMRIRTVETATSKPRDYAPAAPPILQIV